MPTNEFEKQVQKQLDEFQLNPSASVWKKVEEEITRKKRRRIIFFFLLPVAIGLLGYMSYQFLYTGTQTELAQQQVPAKNERSLSTDKSNTTAEVKEKPLTNPPQEINETGEINKEKIALKKKTNYSQENQLQISSNDPSTGRRKSKQVTEPGDKNLTIKKEPVPSQGINKNVSGKQDDMSVTIENPLTGKDPKNDITKNPEPGKNTQDDTTTLTDKDVVSVKTDSIKKDEVMIDDKKEAIVKPKTGKSRINWGIDLFAGITSNNSNTFSLGNSSRALDMLYSSTGPSSPGNPPVIIPPSPVKSGASFSIGLTGELQVSERSRFSTGLEYVYASNRIKTGSGTDTLISLPAGTSNSAFSSVQVDRVYRGSQQNDHSNGYHFIQIPLWYHWQINKGKKLPVQWNVGVAASYLIATNALVYDPRLGGIYYANKDAFNKMHFNVGTGLSLRLKAKNKMEWVLGPEISFDLTKLMADSYYKKQYLFFGGINAKLFFPKKKAK